MLIASLCVLSLTQALPDDAVIAFVMVDRFADGAANLGDVVPGAPRRFQGGDLAGLRARLGYLHELGFSHVWITPLHLQVQGLVGTGAEATAAYHGYWPTQLDAVDPHFGTVQDVQALVDDAGALGMGIVLDVVTNHLGYGAADLHQLTRHPCGDDERTRCLFGLPDFKTEDPAVAAFVVDKTLWWLQQAPFAGFRYDAFPHGEPSVFQSVQARARQKNPAFFGVAERWGAAAGDAVVDDDIATLRCDAALDFGLKGLTADFLSRRMKTRAFVHHLVNRDRLAAQRAPMVTFLDNHDVESWVHAVGPARAPLGAALLLSTRGIPALSWGTEVGREGGAGDPDNRTFMPWARVQQQQQQPSSSLWWWSRLIHLRRALPALRNGALRVLASDVDGHGSQFVVFERVDANDRVIVALALQAGLVSVLPLAAGEHLVDVISWHGATADSMQESGAARLRLEVPAEGAVVVHLRF